MDATEIGRVARLVPLLALDLALGTVSAGETFPSLLADPRGSCDSAVKVRPINALGPCPIVVRVLFLVCEAIVVRPTFGPVRSGVLERSCGVWE